MKNDTLGVIAALTIIAVSGSLISYRKATHGAPVETVGLLFVLIVLVTIGTVGIRPFYRVMLRL